MVRHDGMDNLGGLAVLAGQLGPDDRVGSLYFVINRLAQIMQQTGSLGLLDVQTKLGGHNAAEESHFE